MQENKHFWRNVFILLFIITIGLLFWLIIDLRGLYRVGGLKPTRSLNRNFTFNKKIASPDQIQSWMTFSYIDYIFNLPPDYLSKSLNINDSKYPNLGIRQYAKLNNLDSAVFLKQVQDSVIEYAKSIPQ